MIAFLIFVLIVVVIVRGINQQDSSFEGQSLRDRVAALEVQVRRLSDKSGLSAAAPLPPEPIKPLEERPEPLREPSIPRAFPPIDLPSPRPLPKAFPAAQPAVVYSKPSPPIDWEKFMGVQLFAWLGGFALFLGMAFFVKYSIDHNLISPLARVTIGFLIGIGVIIGGLAMRRKGYEVTVQTLCAAGIAILYADIFACRSMYNFLTPEAAFGLMALVTAASFVLADRLDSLYVALLGLVGGFLTPVLLSTGVDRPLGLFSYILILDLGLLGIARRKSWEIVPTLAAVATFLMELGWTMKFFTPEKIAIAGAVYLLFPYLFLLFAELDKNREEDLIGKPAGAFAVASTFFIGYLLQFPSIAGRPGVLLTLLLVLSIQPAFLAVRRESNRLFYGLGGLAAFVILFAWTHEYLKGPLLLWGLGYYLAFAVVHSVFPILLQRVKPTKNPFLWGYAAPLLMMLLILGGMCFMDLLSFVVWPFVMILGMIGVAAGWLAGSVLATGATVLLVMACFAVWLFRLPDMADLSSILCLLGITATAFFAWGLFVTGRKALFKANSLMSKAGGISPEEAAELPAASALMPFLLLALVCLKLPLANPSQVFGLMILMIVLLFGLIRYRGVEVLAPISLLASFFVQLSWYSRSFQPNQYPLAISWFGGVYLLFALFPFIVKKSLKGTAVWHSAALAGPLQFVLLYMATVNAVGKAWIGLLPAIMAVPALMGLLWLVSEFPAADERRTEVLASWGATALLFITLIIPLQFSNEWISLGWMVEGAALVWLFRRIPHEGLKVWGMALMVIAFARLAMNPAVLSYHPRTATPIFNWYLGVYGASILSLLAGARWLAPPRNRLGDWDLPPILNGLAAVLTFLLLNIEIADFFSKGATITFQFSGNLAQDMTYSLAWAAYGTVLLCIGIKTGSQSTRYASLGLILATIVKVFLHDLWRLGQLYRVASIVGLAVVLMLISFLYQRFLAQEKPREVRHA